MCAVTERRIPGVLALAERHFLLLRHHELHGQKLGSSVRTITERLGVRLPAAAPIEGPWLSRQNRQLSRCNRGFPHRTVLLCVFHQLESGSYCV